MRERTMRRTTRYNPFPTNLALVVDGWTKSIKIDAVLSPWPIATSIDGAIYHDFRDWKRTWSAAARTEAQNIHMHRKSFTKWPGSCLTEAEAAHALPISPRTSVGVSSVNTTLYNEPVPAGPTYHAFEVFAVKIIILGTKRKRKIAFRRYLFTERTLHTCGCRDGVSPVKLLRQWQEVPEGETMWLLQCLYMMHTGMKYQLSDRGIYEHL